METVNAITCPRVVRVIQAIEGAEHDLPGLGNLKRVDAYA